MKTLFLILLFIAFALVVYTNTGIQAAISPHDDGSTEEPAQNFSRTSHSAIIYIDGARIMAKDANGETMASGIAGIDDVAVINTAFSILGTNAIVALAQGTRFIVSGDIPIILNADGQTLISYDNNTASGNAIVYCASGSYDLVRIYSGTQTHVDSSAIEGITFQGGKMHIDVRGANFIKIRNCQFYRSSEEAIKLGSVWGAYIQHNYFESCGSAANGKKAIRSYKLYPDASEVSTAITISDNLFELCSGGLLQGDSIVAGSKFVNNWAEQNALENNVYEINLTSGADSTIDGNKLYNVGGGTGTCGIFIAGYYARVTNNLVAGNYTYGIYNTAAKGCQISGNTISEYIGNHPDLGIWVRSSTNSDGYCNIFGNYVSGATTGMLIENLLASNIFSNTISDCRGKSIRLYNISHGNIYGNNINTISGEYGIIEENNCDYNIIHENQIIGTTTAIRKVGIHTKIWRNAGYMTENSGSSIGTGSDQTIPHGLIATPSKVVITPTSNGTVVNNTWADEMDIHLTVTYGKSYNWTAEVWS